MPWIQSEERLMLVARETEVKLRPNWSFLGSVSYGLAVYSARNQHSRDMLCSIVQFLSLGDMVNPLKLQDY